MRAGAAEKRADLLDEILARLAAVEEQLEQLRLEQHSRRGPRDEADRALLVQIADSTHSRLFSASGLLDHANRVDDALRQALEDADISTVAEVGCWLRRFAGREVDGISVRRRRRRRWTVEHVGHIDVTAPIARRLGE